MHRLLDDMPLDGAVLLMRHGERPIIDDPTRAEEVLLTAEGLRSARELGRELLAAHPIQGLFHSTVRRCGQTAEAILEGLRSRGRHPVNHGPQPQLAVPYLPDPQRSYAYALRRNLDSLGFIRAWFDGGLAADVVREPRGAAREQLAFLYAAKRSHPGFGVHVSHDWNILLLAWHFLGVEPSGENWPGFLEGLLIHFGGDAVTFRFRNHESILEPSALGLP